MGQHSLPGNPPVPLQMRTSARARRITLRISSLDGTVTLTRPRGVSERAALAFAREKEAWLRDHLEKQDDGVDVGLGAVLPIEGQARQVMAGGGRRVLLEPGRVLVPGPEDRVASRLLGFLKTHARGRLAEASDRYAARLGRGYTRLTLRDTRSRWGSCTADGGLMYSWRLILAPPEVLDYVAAHEVAHLQEMNHSADFWAVVTRLYGPYQAQRRWLHREGAALHRIRFS
ncbi:M48 family metallopeptidase [Marinovum sp.]|uniref:M48 family metallopeptidase n=1 Tax=Marinovum sp. TaxID=2024839 RepID=UPI003A8DA003